jgi:glycosyltransferase involved in cell wall biosynthesis
MKTEISKPMNIIAFKRLNPYYVSSASNNRFRSLIENLKEHGAEVHVYVYGGYQADEEFLKFSQKGVFFNKIQYTYLLTYKNTNIWKRRLDNYVLKHFRQFFFNAKISKLMKHTDEAIFWLTDDIELQIAINRLPKKQNHTYFTEISEFLDIHMAHKGNFAQRAVANKAQDMFEKQTYFKLDAMALMTKTLYKHYEQNFPKGPELLHLPMTVDFLRFEQSDDANHLNLKKPYAVFTGIMCDMKDGVNILIDAFASISSDYPDLNLYLFGPWHYDLPGHIKQIKQLKLEDRVFFKGLIDRDKIPNVLMNAKFLVMPRPDSKQAQGGFPTKLGEYLASGKPVCATAVGELPDYLKDNESVYFSIPGNTASFKESMIRLLKDDEKSRKIGFSGKEVAYENFNAKKQGKSLFDFLLSNTKIKA